MPEWEQPFFVAIEEIDYPSELKVVDQHQLYVAWLETNHSLVELEDAFKQCGGEIIKAYQFADGGDVEELLFTRRNDQLIMIHALEEGLKVPSDFSEEDEHPPILQSLFQDY